MLHWYEELCYAFDKRASCREQQIFFVLCRIIFTFYLMELSLSYFIILDDWNGFPFISFLVNCLIVSNFKKVFDDSI